MSGQELVGNEAGGSLSVATVSNNEVTSYRSHDSKTAGITKLSGKNFLPWRRQVLMILKLRGLEKAITEETVDENTDMMAMLILLETMDEGHQIQVQAETTAKQIMDSLSRQYADESATSKGRLLVSYLTTKKSPQDTMARHLGKMKEIRAALINLGDHVKYCIDHIVQHRTQKLS